MSIAYFYTWTTYGTWLPGDDRGWFQRGGGFCAPERWREFSAALQMTDSAIVLDTEQRKLVEKTVADHCIVRCWDLHASNCRTNHVHVLITADERKIQRPREQFKAWCTRRLKELDVVRGTLQASIREDWWTQRGWDEYVDDEQSLARVRDYINEGQ